MAKKVLVPIADGSEEIEAVVIIDVLRRAGAHVVVASVDQSTVRASRGVKLTADRLIGECQNETFDLIALPGGMPGAEHLRDSHELIHLLKQQQKDGHLYAAICASPSVVFQHHGLLENRRATCFPSRAHTLTNQDAIHSRVVVDGSCITSQGPGTSLEFALKLVELLFGSPKRDEVARALVMPTD
ncbi:MAG: DJ-1 family glyoxalase III [Candidatus Omnitrophota bacterium]